MTLDLKEKHVLSGVVLQAPKTGNNYMKSFKVIISNSSNFNSFSDVKVDNFKEFKISDDGTEINGPGDKKYIFSFKTPALGRYMKIIPVSWNGLISIRLSPIGAKTSNNNIDNFIDKDNKANLFENFTVMKKPIINQENKAQVMLLLY